MVKYSLLVPDPITANFHKDSVILFILLRFQKNEVSVSNTQADQISLVFSCYRDCDILFVSNACRYSLGFRCSELVIYGVIQQ